MIKYINIYPEDALPNISEYYPFKAIVIIEEQITQKWQMEVSRWLVNEGCLYMMAWGHKCSSWDDSVDMANLENFDFKKVPDDKFVMTTWHEDEPLKEVFWYSKFNAFHPTKDIENALLIHISKENKESILISNYNNAYRDRDAHH